MKRTARWLGTANRQPAHSVDTAASFDSARVVLPSLQELETIKWALASLKEYTTLHHLRALLHNCADTLKPTSRTHQHLLPAKSSHACCA